MADSMVPQGAEMSQLRQEAIRRAREMHARAMIPTTIVPPEPPPKPEPEPKPEEPTPAQPAPPQNQAQRPHGEQAPVHQRTSSRPSADRRPEAGGMTPSIDGVLDFLTKDPERAIILVLLLILMEEKADNSLIFAMMYLLS